MTFFDYLCRIIFGFNFSTFNFPYISIKSFDVPIDFLMASEHFFREISRLLPVFFAKKRAVSDSPP